jgi:hypothetical protein
MGKELMDKFINMIMTDIGGTSVSKRVGDLNIIIKFNYDTEKDIITYERGVFSSKGFTQIDKGVLKNIAALSKLIEKSDMSKEFELKVKSRIDKERKLQELKEDMLSRLEKMDLDAEQKKLVISVINKVTQLSVRVGMANRVYLVSDGDYSEHVRVTGPSKWNDEGEELHLQLIQAMDLGVKHHGYPDLSFEEIVGKILSSPLLAKENDKNLKQ